MCTLSAELPPTSKKQTDRQTVILLFIIEWMNNVAKIYVRLERVSLRYHELVTYPRDLKCVTQAGR